MKGSRSRASWRWPRMPDHDFDALALKIERGQRLSFGDGLALFRHPDVVAIGQLANRVRERLHGDRTYFNRNLRIEVTNVCVASCLFCSFAKLEEGMPGAHTMALEDAWKELEDAPGRPAERDSHRQRTSSDIAFSVLPGSPVGIQAIGARRSFEVLYCRGDPFLRPAVRDDAFAEVLERLRAAGLDSLPGGGAEIFHPDVRSRIARGKATARRVAGGAPRRARASECTATRRCSTAT